MEQNQKSAEQLKTSETEESKIENKQAEQTEKKSENATNASQLDKQKIQNLYLTLKALVAFKMTKTDNKPNEIIENLYLGSIGASLSKETLKNIGITHILSAMDRQKSPFPDLFEYKIIKLADSLTENILQHFEDSNSWIHDKLQNNKKVLIHCFAGKSRSTTLIIAYLIWNKQMSRDKALELVKSKRPIAQPNFWDKATSVEIQNNPSEADLQQLDQESEVIGNLQGEQQPQQIQQQQQQQQQTLQEN